MTFLDLLAITVSCVAIQSPASSCVPNALAAPTGEVAGSIASLVPEPVFLDQAVDVELTARSALVWDLASGKNLYEKNVNEKRPVASLSKLLAALAIREVLPLDMLIKIPPDVRQAQQKGADIGLPVGHHASVRDLLAASLIPSANDAAVALATAAKGSEEVFVTFANDFAQRQGLHNTLLANATGLAGGNQHSTAYDMKEIMIMTFTDPVLRPYLSQERGVLLTQEGKSLSYRTTNELSGTYLPILAAKTGFTYQAGENLVLITHDQTGNRIGAVILGSGARFQDMKALVEWIWQNYEWPSQ